MITEQDVIDAKNGKCGDEDTAQQGSVYTAIDDFRYKEVLLDLDKVERRLKSAIKRYSIQNFFDPPEDCGGASQDRKSLILDRLKKALHITTDSIEFVKNQHKIIFGDARMHVEDAGVKQAVVKPPTTLA